MNFPKDFVAIDFETADYGADSACSVGLVKVEDNAICEEMVRLIRPPRQDFRFTHIHGLTWNDVAEAPVFADVWPEMEAFIGSTPFLVAHNAPFDRKVLNSCLEAASLTPHVPDFLCTVQVARHKLKIKPAKLSNVCEVLGIELNHHEALSDARASAKVLIEAARQAGLQEELSL
jgi:DNA polymerase-3 subunit epsilon